MTVDVPKMPDWLKEIAATLHDNNLGTLGTDVFYLDFKASVPNCIAIADLPGYPDEVSLDGKSILFKPSLNIRVRNMKPGTAKSKALAIFNLLNLSVNKQIGDTRFKRIEGIDKPYFVSKSNTAGTVYSMTFELQIE
jgi:hypothetical protein